MSRLPPACHRAPIIALTATILLAKERKQGSDILARFRELAPRRSPISIQRWSMQRVALTLSVVLGALITLALVLDNIRTGAL